MAASGLSNVVVKEINQRRGARSYWPFAALPTTALVGLFYVWLGPAGAWLVGPAAAAGLTINTGVWRLDRYRRTTRLAYMWRTNDAAYWQACAACRELAASSWVWHVRHDAKDAGNTRREKVGVVETWPPFIRANVPVWGIQNDHFGLYFLPDGALLYADQHYMLLPYSSLRTLYREVQYVEHASHRTADGAVVGFVREGKGVAAHLHRSSAPLMRYGEILITSTVGLKMTFMASNERAAKRAGALFVALSRLAEGAASSGAGQAASERASRGRTQDRWSDLESDVARAYAVLGLDPKATAEQLKQAYHRVALRCHPDRLSANAGAATRRSAEKEMGEVSAAYTLLHKRLHRV